MLLITFHFGGCRFLGLKFCRSLGVGFCLCLVLSYKGIIGLECVLGSTMSSIRGRGGGCLSQRHVGGDQRGQGNGN